MTLAPIKPDEVVEKKLNTLPDFVISSFNELIATNWNGKQSIVYQPVVLLLIKQKMKLANNFQEFNYNWLDVEPIYRKEGWKVSYDKPGYNENYSAYFVFEKER